MSHACFVCSGAPPGGFARHGGLRMTVPPLFCGPPGNINGGMAVGMLACPALQVAAREGGATARVTRITARLRAGIPADRPLELEVAAAGPRAYEVTVRDGAAGVMTATVTVERDGEPVQAFPRADDVAEIAAIAVPDVAPWFVDTGDHPIPGCFSCGPDNARGLHIYPRVVRDGVTCAPWDMDRTVAFADPDGRLSTAVLTSAIDCSSGICMPIEQQRDLLARDEFFLLGTMDARYLRDARAGEPYRVAAKALARDGRKFFGRSCLADEHGTAYAVADSTWIVANMSRTAAFGRTAGA